MIAARFLLVAIENTVASDPTELGDEQVKWSPGEGDFVVWGEETYQVMRRAWIPRHPMVDLVVTVIEDPVAKEQKHVVKRPR